MKSILIADICYPVEHCVRNNSEATQTLLHQGDFLNWERREKAGIRACQANVTNHIFDTNGRRDQRDVVLKFS